MVTMFRTLQEDNKDILAIIAQVDELIARLRAESKIPKEYLVPFFELYQESVGDFEERFYMRDIEVPADIQQEYEDLLYDLILTLKVFDV